MREAVYDRPARIAETEKLGHLVVGFARCVISCSAERRIAALFWNIKERCMPARDDERNGRVLDLWVLEDDGIDVTFDMIYPDDRNPSGHCERFGKADSHEKRANKTRPLSHGHCAEIISGDEKERTWKTVRVGLQEFAGKDTTLRLYQRVLMPGSFRVPGKAYWRGLSLR